MTAAKPGFPFTFHCIYGMLGTQLRRGKVTHSRKDFDFSTQSLAERILPAQQLWDDPAMLGARTPVPLS